MYRFGDYSDQNYSEQEYSEQDYSDHDYSGQDYIDWIFWKKKNYTELSFLKTVGLKEDTQNLTFLSSNSRNRYFLYR